MASAVETSRSDSAQSPAWRRKAFAVRHIAARCALRRRARLTREHQRVAVTASVARVSRQARLVGPVRLLRDGPGRASWWVSTLRRETERVGHCLGSPGVVVAAGRRTHGGSNDTTLVQHRQVPSEQVSSDRQATQDRRLRPAGRQRAGRSLAETLLPRSADGAVDGADCASSGTIRSGADPSGQPGVASASVSYGI